MPMMATLLIYDIPDDGLRAKVADACLDYGLDRIQYSAFLGELTHNRQEQVLQRIKRIPREGIALLCVPTNQSLQWTSASQPMALARGAPPHCATFPL